MASRSWFARWRIRRPRTLAPALELTIGSLKESVGRSGRQKAKPDQEESVSKQSSDVAGQFCCWHCVPYDSSALYRSSLIPLPQPAATRDMSPLSTEADHTCQKPGLQLGPCRGPRLRARGDSPAALRTCDDAIPWELWGELWGALFRSASGYPWPISPAPNRSCSPA